MIQLQLKERKVYDNKKAFTNKRQVTITMIIMDIIEIAKKKHK